MVERHADVIQAAETSQRLSLYGNRNPPALECFRPATHQTRAMMLPLYDRRQLPDHRRPVDRHLRVRWAQ
jgi:hypothetical protein